MFLSLSPALPLCLKIDKIFKKNNRCIFLNGPLIKFENPMNEIKSGLAKPMLLSSLGENQTEYIKQLFSNPGQQAAQNCDPRAGQQKK